MRAVIDTNVLVSGLLWSGAPHGVIRHIRAGAVILLFSPSLLAELDEVIRRPKFRPILARTGTSPDDLLAELQTLAELIDPPPLCHPASRDRDDDAVLARAVAAKADLIVTGDEDLLVFKVYEDIPIVSPAQALAKFAEEGGLQ